MSVPHFKKEGAQCRNVSEMRITDNTSKILNLEPNIQAFKETRKIATQINAKGGGRITGMVGVPCSGLVGVASAGIYT